jgi:hypothetical protein
MAGRNLSVSSGEAITTSATRAANTISSPHRYRHFQLAGPLMTLGAVELYRALLHTQIPSYYNEHVRIGVSCHPTYNVTRGHSQNE